MLQKANPMTALPVDQQITFLYTHDLAATAVFYEDMMGLSLVRDQGDCRIYKVSTDGYIGFCKRATAPEEPAGIILTIITDNVDGWYAQLKTKGAAFTQPPEHNPKYQIYHCFLRDPNGYLIEIQRFDDPLP